jgi:NADPH:quinone reductase-like Zn-dependent oxidoreductase
VSWVVAHEELEQYIKSVALDGLVNFIGRLAGGSAAVDIDIIYRSAATIRVVFAGHRAHFSAMNRAISVNRLTPIIDRVFSFDDAFSAFRYYETGKPFGKVIISHV